MATRQERNYRANEPRIETAILVFTKTGNIAQLVTTLAECLTPAQFDLLIAFEFNNLPLTMMEV